MKKSAFVAIVVMALVFGLVAYATADSKSVTVTAKVNPVFSMTIDDTTFAYPDIDVADMGVDMDLQGPVITVKSNKTYAWSLVDPTCDSALNDLTSETNMLLIESQAVAATQGSIGARGVSVMDVDYTLDLNADAAWDVAPDDYTFTYGYTAVQD